MTLTCSGGLQIQNTVNVISPHPQDPTDTRVIPYTSRMGSSAVLGFDGMLSAGIHDENDVRYFPPHAVVTPYPTGQKRLRVTASYNGPGGSVTNSVLVDDQTGISYTLSIEVEMYVAPATTFGPGSGAAPGGTPFVWPAAGFSGTPAVVALYRLKPGGNWSATTSLGASVSGTFPTTGTTFLTIEHGLETYLGVRVDTDAQAGTISATASATANMMGTSISIGGHYDGTLPSSYSIAGTPSVTIDYSSGVSVTGTGSLNTFYGSVPPSSTIGPRQGEVYGSPRCIYRVKGGVRRGPGYMAGPFTVDIGRSSVGGFTPSLQRSVTTGGAFDFTVEWQPILCRASGGTVTVAEEKFSYGFSAGISASSASANGLPPIGVTFDTRVKPFRAIEIQQASTTPFNIPPAAGWDIGLDTGYTISNITGGIRVDYDPAIATNPTAKRQRPIKTLYPTDGGVTVDKPYVSQRTQAYRYLKFQARSIDLDDQPAYILLSGSSSFSPPDSRYWQFTTGNAGDWVDVEIDLCAPDGRYTPVPPYTLTAFDPDAAQLDTSQGILYTNVSSPMDTRSQAVTEPPSTWGVDVVVWLIFRWMGSGESYEVRNFELVQKTAQRIAGTYEVLSGSNPTRVGVMDTDGKRSFELISLSSGTLRTIDQMRLDTSRVLGLTGIAPPVNDPDWSYNPSTLYVGGSGMLHPPIDGIDTYLDAPTPYIYSQPRAIYAHAMPGMGDVFGSGSSATSGETTMYVMPNYGGLVTGIGYGSDGKPTASGTVTVEESSGGAASGSAITDTRGRYVTGPPGAHSYRGQKVNGELTSVTYTPNRLNQVRRICLRVDETQPEGSVFLAHDPYTGIELEIVAEDGTVSTTATIPGGAKIEAEVGPGYSAQGYIRRSGDFVVAFSDDLSTHIATSFDQGEHWSEVHMPVTGTLPATPPPDPNTGIEVIATWEGDEWTAWRMLPGETEFTSVGVIVSGVEKQAGMSWDPQMDGALKFRFDSGAGIEHRYSRDHGDNWTTT